MFGKAARDVLVQNARDDRLVRHAFFKRFDLNVTQVAGRQANVDAPILDARRACSRLELDKLSFVATDFSVPLS